MQSTHISPVTYTKCFEEFRFENSWFEQPCQPLLAVDGHFVLVRHTKGQDPVQLRSS